MKQLKGFAAMDPSKQREIASSGGRAAHASGNAHQFTPQEAQAAAYKMQANKQAKREAADEGNRVERHLADVKKNGLDGI